MKLKTNIVIITCWTVLGSLNACNNPKDKPMEMVVNDPTVNKAELNEEVNKKLVMDFYQQMFGDKDITAVDRFIGSTYTQHNPMVADGPQAFKDAAKVWFDGQPKTKIDVQHIAADKDLVFIHLKNKNPDGTLKSTIDIFRIENGKIVEHWDVQQDVPKTAANKHPMF